MIRRFRIPVEVTFTGAMVLLMLALSAWYQLPIRLPTGNSANRMGVEFALPVLGIGVWLACSLFAQRKASPWRPLLALLCYVVVMVVHFNLKLWVPYVRADSYDPLLWQIDQQARPLVDLCMAIRRVLIPLLQPWTGLYLWSFMVMFYISFGYHAIRTPEVFRKLFLAALFLQGMGAIGYLLMPAVGPFIYEAGISAGINAAQQQMLEMRQLSVAAGPHWLADNASANLFGGLGAMPSLHAGCSSLFLWFAWHHGRVLLPTYIPIFAFILVTAVASRWHYLIDLPVGIALARLAIHLAHVADRPRDAAADDPVATDDFPMAEPLPA
jgi:hypothetical protein